MKFDKSAFNSVVKRITSNLCMAKRETVADHFSSFLYDKQLSVESLSERNRIRLQKKGLLHYALVVLMKSLLSRKLFKKTYLEDSG